MKSPEKPQKSRYHLEGFHHEGDVLSVIEKSWGSIVNEVAETMKKHV